MLVPELSRLGRSTFDVLEILKEAKGKGFSIYIIKDGFKLNGTIQSKIMSTMPALFAELEREFISQRTKEGLKAARAKGKQPGRPEDPGKSKFDKYREEITALLRTGSKQTYPE